MSENVTTWDNLFHRLLKTMWKGADEPSLPERIQIFLRRFVGRERVQ